MRIHEKPTPFLKKYPPMIFRVALVLSILVMIVAFRWEMDYTPAPDWTLAEPETESPFLVTLVEPPKPKEKLPEVKKIKPPPVVFNPIPVPDPIPDPVLPDPEPEPMPDPPPVIPAPVAKPTPFAEVMPQFPGGDNALLQHLGRTSYCAIAKENDIEGTVYVEWIVDVDGSVRDVTIKRGVFSCLDEEVKRRVQAMPKWTPGRQGGNPVPVIMVAPIRFSLD